MTKAEQTYQEKEALRISALHQKHLEEVKFFEKWRRINPGEPWQPEYFR